MRSLTQLERLSAMSAAQDAVKASFGQPPTLDQFAVAQRRMTSADIIIWLLAIFILIAAFALSAIRLFSIGEATFLESINHAPSGVVAGVSIVILAEITQLISGIALARVEQAGLKRILWWVGMGATALAIIGNVEVVRPLERSHPLFAVFEALFPPLVVLAVSHVLKVQLLSLVLNRQAAQVEYEAAFAQWQADVGRKPEEHDEWPRFYANALRDQLIKANRRSKVGRDMIETMTPGDWRRVVMAEMQNEHWYHGLPATQQERRLVDVQKPPEPPRDPSQPEVMTYTSSPAAAHAEDPTVWRNRTRELVTQAYDRIRIVNDQHVTACPLCSKQFEKSTEAELKKAVTVHISRFCPKRKD